MEKVTLDQGVLIGKKCTAISGFQYVEFLQIPYAKPPINDLRFKAPQPPEAWKGERDATVSSDKNVCYQLDVLVNTVRGSEDCLYLNVYTPRLPSVGSELMPVMVFFHSGGFNIGNGTIKEEGGPDHLIRHDIIMISINYRLGIFGFLSLDIPEAAGNMGLKDQVMALKWIQNNISKFGGDKNNVTLFGCSAGSASVQHHMMSPQSKDLFHKGIFQSGAAINHWAMNNNVRDLAIKVSQELGYQGSPDDSYSIYRFLMKQTMESLLDVCLKHAHFTVLRGCSFGFLPCVEKIFENSDAFITEYPYDILKSGKFNKVKSMIGFCDSEGLLIKGAKPVNFAEIGQNKDFASFLTYQMERRDVDFYNEKFASVYDVTTSDPEDKYAIDYFTDLDFASGVWISSEIIAENGVDVYEYIFSYDGSFNVYKKIFNLTDKGACHADDTGYILSYGLLNDVKYDERDMIMRDRLTKMWTDFAKTGNPTPSTNELIPISWPLFNNDTKKYLKLDDELEIKNDYMPQKIAVHREIYEKYRR